MSEDRSEREARILDQLRRHRLPSEWVDEIGCEHGDTMLLMIWLDLLARRVNAAHLDETRREGLAASEAKLLFYLLLEGPPYHQSPTRLNARLELTSGGITKAVDRLETRGLVKREPDADDGRSIKVGLTVDGVEAARRVARAFSARYRELARPLGREKTQRTVAMLRELLDVLEGPL